MVDYTQKAAFEPGRILELDNGLAEPASIFFGYDIEGEFIDHLEKATRGAPVDRLFFLTDRRIFDRFGARFFNRLKAAYPNISLHLVPEGENSKTFGVLQDLCDTLIGSQATKGSLLIAFGGGSIGNISGIAAGLVFRGIRFVEVPTTLSHQTDGTLSNKQAINSRFGKNHYGLYHAPVFIWTDTKYLETEPAIFKKSGIVEGIKNGMVDQAPFVDYLEAHLKSDCQYSPDEITDLCHKLMLSKIEIIRKDPTEKQYAIILEYGHTFGHAVEWLAQGGLTHGESVAIGMKFAAELACRLGYVERAVVDRHYRLIDDKLGLKSRLPDRVESAAVLDTMYLDNKKSSSDVGYVLLERIGRCKSENGDYLIKADRAVVQEVVERFVDNYRRPA